MTKTTACGNCKKDLWVVNVPWAGEEYMFCDQACEEQWAYYQQALIPGRDYPEVMHEILGRDETEP